MPSAKNQGWESALLWHWCTLCSSSCQYFWLHNYSHKGCVHLVRKSSSHTIFEHIHIQTHLQMKSKCSCEEKKSDCWQQNKIIREEEKKITSSTLLRFEIMKSTWPSICSVPWSPSCHLCPSISHAEIEKWINFIFLFKYMLLCVSTETLLSGNLPQASEDDIMVTFGHNFTTRWPKMGNQINLAGAMEVHI